MRRERIRLMGRILSCRQWTCWNQMSSWNSARLTIPSSFLRPKPVATRQNRSTTWWKSQGQMRNTIWRLCHITSQGRRKATDWPVWTRCLWAISKAVSRNRWPIWGISVLSRRNAFQRRLNWWQILSGSMSNVTILLLSTSWSKVSKPLGSTKLRYAWSVPSPILGSKSEVSETTT